MKNEKAGLVEVLYRKLENTKKNLHNEELEHSKTRKQLRELRKAYNIALGEINRLRDNLHYNNLEDKDD